MRVCKVCGVELEDEMEICPLCDTPVNGYGDGIVSAGKQRERKAPAIEKRHLLGQILWQITSVLLLSGIVATLSINLAIQGRASWSLYPVTICLILFSYASLMALWRTKRILQVFAGWILSVLVLVAVDWFADVRWALQLALPIVCAINLMGFLVYFVLRQLKQKGLNAVAVIFIAIALLCLTLEGIISLYFHGEIRLQWSVIVTACLLPVVVAIFFMYFRTRNNAELKKIFHT